MKPLCATCGKPFYVRPSTVAKGSGRFCSRACKGAAQRGVSVNVKHGLYGSPTWKTWDGMKQRCLNPKSKDYPRYGGRGIRVCARWVQSIDNFVADMGLRPSGTTIERVNNDGNYEPGNCVWATPRAQANNRRGSEFIAYLGRTLTIAQWAREVGMGPKTLLYRLRAGWSIQQALSKPSQRGEHHHGTANPSGV